MMAILKVLGLSVIGGYIFSLLHIPIPWMLGPIIVVMLAQFIHKGPLKWPHQLGNLGVVVVGTGIGVRFNIELFHMFGSILMYMLLLNVILIGGSIGIAFLTSKWTKMPMSASLLGAIPGGLGQIIIFAEREKMKELGVIFYFQVIRLLLVVIVVPFIVAGQAAISQPVNAKLTISLLVLIALGWGCSYLLDRINFPVAYFITPILMLIALQLSTPLDMPHVPRFVMVIAQIFIGAHIGLMLKPDMVKLPIRVLVGGIGSALALILLTFGSSFIMEIAMDTSFATSFLSTAPGGLDQMVLLADAVHADISLVSTFQTFRLLFIFILVMPLLKLFYKWREKKANQYKQESNVGNIKV